MKVAVLLLSVLLCCEGSRLREGFHKLFKREPKKCDIIWTEQIHPHCETTHEKVCEEVYQDECHTEYTEECKKTYEEICKTEFLTDCKQEFQEICNTEYSTECKTEYIQECSSHPHCEMVEEEKCSTKYQKICDNEGAAKKVKEWEESGRKQKRHAPSLEEAEVEEIERRLDLQGPFPLTEKDTVVKKFLDPPPAGLGIPYTVVKSRMRRGDRFQRALELIGLKKKTKENLCHHIPHKHCVMVSVEKCHNVEKCWQEPKEICLEEPQERCHQEPQERCEQIPQEKCWQEPRNKCRQEPHKKCTQVPKEVCKEVAKEHCEYLPKLVAKKKCEKQKKFVDKLKELVSW